MNQTTALILHSALGVVLAFAGCDFASEPLVGARNAGGRVCNVDLDGFSDGGIGKDAIPALTNPLLIPGVEADYLVGGDRVVGLIVNGTPIAIPHNVLWAHEVVNFDFGTARLAVTYCPLTGSSMVFDRSVIGGAEFGVSGLLFKNNLTLYDRTTSESLWPQMQRQAACGPRLGAVNPMVPAIEMTWAGWARLNPQTLVVSDETGFESFEYTEDAYPYGDYEDLDNDALLEPMPLDGRRSVKERVLGILDGRRGGLAVPFLELDRDGPLRAVHVSVGRSIVVFWDRSALSAMAYLPTLNGQKLEFQVEGEVLRDTLTGSEWRVDGRAVAGPLEGSKLEPVAEAYVAFWFAWAAFHPDTEIWQAP